MAIEVLRREFSRISSIWGEEIVRLRVHTISHGFGCRRRRQRPRAYPHRCLSCLPRDAPKSRPLIYSRSGDVSALPLSRSIGHGEAVPRVVGSFGSVSRMVYGSRWFWVLAGGAMRLLA